MLTGIHQLETPVASVRHPAVDLVTNVSSGNNIVVTIQLQWGQMCDYFRCSDVIVFAVLLEYRG